jgi:DNA helicase-4
VGPTEKSSGWKRLDPVRRLLWGKPSAVVIRGDLIIFEVDGNKGSLPLAEYQSSHCDETFLGLFGTDLILVGQGDERFTIPGLKKKDAAFLKDKLGIASRELAIRRARVFLEEREDEIQGAWDSLQQDHYISKKELFAWLGKYSEIKGLAYIPVTAITSEAALSCRVVFLDADAWRKSRNDSWVVNEIKEQEAFLDSVTGKTLTPSQKEAVVSHDNAVLVVAGAGTGKTTTVITKVAYLLQKGICRPEDILLLSFSKSAAKELRERIASVTDAKIEARTFHSLGLEIIKESRGKPAVSGKASDIGSTLNQILTKIMAEGSEATRLLIRYLAYAFYPEKKEHEFTDWKSQLSWASRNDITTLNGEKVKSNQEAQIANWFLLNGINYEYETAYKGVKTGTKEKRVYKPDFYLPDYDIYIEHFGISRNGKTKSGIDSKEYLRQMEWKRQLHKEHKTILVETYSYQGFEGDLEQYLETQLVALGVEIIPMAHEELAKLKYLQERVKVMAAFLSRCLALYKGNHEGGELLSQIAQDPQVSQREKSFLSLFNEVLERYQSTLKKRGEIDFGDMITKAASLVRSGEYQSRFKVIIIDEFQDISKGRAFLIQSLLDQVEDPRLLCVGDDWQSIYRFNGSDVTLMTQFDRHWEDPVKINLRETQRFGQELQEVSTRFITSNPGQIQRTLAGRGSLGRPAVHITRNGASTILEQIKESAGSAESVCPDVIILGRYKHSLEGVWGDELPENPPKGMTAHASKGLEADYVIVMGLGVGRYGFPTEIEDDPIISLFLAEGELFENAEERRLFYVALTRARKEVWLVPNANGISPFLEELMNDPKYNGLVACDDGVIQIGVKCPECDGSMLVRSRKSDGTKFLGCTYHPRCSGILPGCPQCGQSIPKRKGNWVSCQQCDWSAPACPKVDCQHGYMILRTNGNFLGCSSYSKTGCRGTLPIQSSPKR